MTLRQLKILDVVARTLSITKAAGEIGISQPSISKQLRLLEGEFGVKFHRKSGRGIQLTDEGDLVVNRVRSILSELGELEKTFAIRQAERSNTLTIVGSENLAEWPLPQTLKGLKARHPGVQTVLKTADSRKAERLLLNGEAELALSNNPCENREIDSTPLRSEEVVAAVSPRSPLNRKSRLSLADLARVPWSSRRVESYAS